MGYPRNRTIGDQMVHALPKFRPDDAPKKGRVPMTPEEYEAVARKKLAVIRKNLETVERNSR